MFFVEEFRHLKLQLQDVLSATDNFDPNKVIGHGGFGKVYKGEISQSEKRCMVAFKRLDSKFGQGNTEFWKEIMMLSKYKHENLISLLHFCFEGDERILVYEYASRGSLDRYLSDASLTWIQRLKICVGVARGLNYLHDPVETKQRVLHRDIKSSNILLDEEWNAKVSDFGLSKIGPANQPQTYLVSNVVGTFGYCDPSYFETGLLSKETDVYSLGVVLFEVMAGKLCCEYRNGKMIRILVPIWKKCFEENRLDDIIFHDLKEQIKHDSLMTFSTIANRCLQRDHKKRPTMVEIVQELEVAVKQQLVTNIIEENDEIKHIEVKLQPATTSGQVDTQLSLLKLASLIEVSSKKGTKDLNLRNKLMEQIEWLPDSLGKLSGLITLDLSENKLVALPSSISGLSSLTRLDLHSNKIVELPESLGDLLSLVFLGLQGNQLGSLPPTISRLIRLQELDLSSNKFSVLPESVGSLVNLQKLNIGTNNIDEIPHVIGHCVSLKELLADYNRLKALPEALGKLESLETLSVQYNDIYRLPTTMSSLASLKELDVSFNKLKSVPETLCFATTIIKINISNNFADLRSLPRSIGNLENLEELDMSNNQIRVLPDSFRMLSKLRVLKTEGNPIEVPPQDVFDKGAQAVVQYTDQLYQKKDMKVQPVKQKKSWTHWRT